MKNDFCSILKASEILTFLFRLFSHVEKQPDEKVKFNFKINDVAEWATNNHNTHTV